MKLSPAPADVAGWVAEDAAAERDWDLQTLQKYPPRRSSGPRRGSSQL